MSQVNHPEIFSTGLPKVERCRNPLSVYIRQLGDQGHPFVESIIKGTERVRQLRATMTTDLVDALGFLPAALSARNWNER